MTVWVILGLPGSGKTKLGEQLAAENSACFHDDPTALEPIIACLQAGHDLIVADPHLCHPRAQARLTALIQEHGGGTTHWFAFENDPVQALANVRVRNDGRRVEGLITGLALEYVIPVGATVYPLPKAT